MLFVSLFLPFVVFADISLSAPALQEKPQINWAFSAIENVDEKDRELMMNDKNPLLELFKRELPEYNHVFFYGTVQRIEHELKTTKLTCYPASTDASRRLEFSYATSLAAYPTPMLITRKEVANKIQNKNGRVFLKKLVKDSRYEGIFIDARSYGVEIDKILAGSENHFKRRVSNPIGSANLQMILNKRADYTIEFLFIVKSMEKIRNGDDLVALPMEDIAASVTQFVICSRTPEGLELVSKLDRIISQNVEKIFYKEAMLRLSPKNNEKVFRKEVEKFVRGRSLRSDIRQ